MVISTKFTHADLLVMPEDGRQREIVDGDLFVTPSPKFSHQAISRRICAAFLKYVESHPIGEIIYAPLDVILSEFDVVEPDLLFVLNEHRSILRDWVRGAPDLVIEILSAATAAHDRGPKLKAYARSGVTEYGSSIRNRESLKSTEPARKDTNWLTSFASTRRSSHRCFRGLCST